MFLSVSLCPFLSLADPIKLDPQGKQTVINLTPGTTKSVTAYVLSKGNESQLVTLYIQAPSGTKVTSRSAVLGTTKELDLLMRTGGWTNSSFLNASGKESSNLVIGSSKSSRSVTRSYTEPEYYCGNSTASDIDVVIALLQETQGLTYTRDQVCEQYGYPVNNSGESANKDGGDGNSGTANPSSTERVQLLVRKDTCSVSAHATYLIRIDLDLSGVAQTALTQNTDIYLGATPIKYVGSKASSLKPVSDGKYSPRPLFLMATTGGAYEKFNLVKWKKNIPTIKNLDIVATAQWRGHSLVRVLADSVLKGGKGVAEMRSETGVYSVCFRLTRTRQSFNGYK